MSGHSLHAHAHRREAIVLHVGGLHYASEKAVERALGARPGVLAVDANPVAQTATVEFDPASTTIENLQQWVEECGYHCAGRSVPATSATRWLVSRPTRPRMTTRRARAGRPRTRARRPCRHVDGRMVRDMRNRFLVAFASHADRHLVAAWRVAVRARRRAHRSGSTNDLWQFCSACRWSSTRRRSSSSARGGRSALGRWT